MTQITVYGGAHEIGGNKILVEWDSATVFLDFGLSFGRLGRFYEEYLQPRGASCGLRDFLAMELLPPIEGLYRPDLLAHEPDLFDRYRDRPIYRRLDSCDGVFLSHAHLDHCGHLGFLRQEISVFTGLTSAVIGKAVQDSSARSVGGEIAYWSEREVTDEGTLKSARERKGRRHLVVADDLPTSLQQFWSTRPSSSDEVVLPPLELLDSSVAPCNYRYWPVDHSIPGAGAWALETSAGWVVFTGDIRLHGRNGRLTEQFAEEAAELDPAVLLIEGTRIAQDEDGAWRDPTPTKEEEVLANAREVIAEEDRCAVADFSGRNIERLETFLSVARDTDRKLVISTKDAYLLGALQLADASLPSPHDPDVRILVTPAGSRRYYWEREVLAAYVDQVVRAEDIRGELGNYLLCLTFWTVKNLIDLRPESGTWLYSSSEAYSEEMAIDQHRLVNWLEHFNLRPVGGLAGQPEEALTEGFHGSGHIHPGGLRAIVETINAEWIVPIHTGVDEAGRWRGTDWFEERWPERVRVPEYGEPLRF